MTGCHITSSQAFIVIAHGPIIAETLIVLKSAHVVQIQAELGEGHVNIIEAKEVLVTHTHLALSLEYAAGGSLTSYVADRWQHSQHAGLFLSEDEARYFFRVRTEAAMMPMMPASLPAAMHVPWTKHVKVHAVLLLLV